MKRRTKYISIAIALAAILLLGAIVELSTTGKPAAFRQIGAQFIHPYRYPVALSADGSMVLVKTRGENTFGLAVYKGASLIASLTSQSSPWELAWDPSGKCIAYLAEGDIAGTYVLNLWWIDSNKKLALAGQITYSAGFPLRWSPDGRRLAYIEYNKGPGQIVILAVKGQSAVLEHIISNVNPDCGYAWSADSSSLVFSALQGAASVDIYSLTNNASRTLVFLHGAKLKDLNWAPSSQLILAAIRLAHDKYYRLAQITLTGQLHCCNLEDGDVEAPVWINNQNAIAYVLQKDAQSRLQTRYMCAASKMCSPPKICSPPKKITPLQAGSMRIQNDGYSHKCAPIIISGASEAPGLFVMQHQSLAPFVVFPQKSVVQNVHIDHIWLKGYEHDVPAWFWTNSSSKPISKAIVIMHGGPHLCDSGEWEPLRQAFAQNGFNVLAINYSGSTGYGTDFENIDNLDIQIKDLNAGIRYLEQPCGIKRKNIIVLASSYGTQVLIGALKQNPNLCGMIILAPLLPPPRPKNDRRADAQPIDYQGVVLAFHGLRDPLSNPDLALHYLHQLFNPATLAHRFCWRVFDHEPHNFSRIGSLQEIYGAACAHI